MKTVHVNTSKPYDVCIGENLLDNAASLILNVKKACRAAVISDDKVYSIYGEKLKNNLTGAGFDVCSYVFPNGEASKNLNTFSDILEFLAENHLTRTDIIVALGGGVTGDIAGFCAAVYLRGIDFVQIPTSLLAAVDSSVGGKTAVDLKGGKNLAGAFHQPVLVICDTRTFDTLDARQMSCGYAEVIKYGMIKDRELFELLESENNVPVSEIVSRCVKIKADVVEGDEFDNGARKLLNFGHTLGHAVEKYSNFVLTHGEAVAAGMAMICRISEKMGVNKEPCTDRLCRLLDKYSLPDNYDIPAEKLYELARGDKKTEGSDITLVLPESVGKCILKKMPLDEFKKILTFGI